MVLIPTPQGPFPACFRFFCSLCCVTPDLNEWKINRFLLLRRSSHLDQVCWNRYTSKPLKVGVPEDHGWKPLLSIKRFPWGKEPLSHYSVSDWGSPLWKLIRSYRSTAKKRNPQIFAAITSIPLLCCSSKETVTAAALTTSTVAMRFINLSSDYQN